MLATAARSGSTSDQATCSSYRKGRNTDTQTSPNLQTTVPYRNVHVQTCGRVRKKLVQKKLTDAHHRRTTTHLTLEPGIIVFTERQGHPGPSQGGSFKIFCNYPLPIPNDDFVVAQNA